MSDDFPTPDELINNTYKSKPKPASQVGISGSPQAPGIPMPQNLSAEQRKAIAIIISGLPFVVVGIRPTAKGTDPTPTGADFHTVLSGDKDTLRAAGPELPGVIERLYSRSGIV